VAGKRGQGDDADLAAKNAELQARVAALEAQLAAAAQTGQGSSVTGDGNRVADRGGIIAGNLAGGFLMTGGTLQGDVYIGDPTTDPREALAIYRRVLISRHSHVHLRGIVPSSPDDKGTERRPDLAEVYVALDTKSLDEPAEALGNKRERPEAMERKPLSALAAAIRNRQLVLLGDPGSGKSTFVAHLGLCLAAHALFPSDGWLHRLPGWPQAESHMVPLPVVLRDFARSPALRESTGGASAKQLWDFLVEQLGRQNLAFAAKPIAGALERGEVLLILDGLDEIAGVEDRGRVRDAVLAFAGRYPGCRLIATCRTLSYQMGPGGAALPGLPAFELAPFDDKQIDRFVTAWYAELGRLGAVRSEDVEPETRALQAAVRRPDIRRLAPNPLLLAVMAAFHAHRGRLPDQRAQLYEDTINLLLWNWEQARASAPGEDPVPRQLLREAGKTDADLYRILARRAFIVHLQSGGEGDGPADIAETDLEKDLANLHPMHSKDWAAKVIEAIRLRAGLLVERTSGVFAFPHRTFQEYLAGAHLAGLGNFATEALELAKRDLALCREMLLLAVGKQVHVNKEVERPLYLAGVLCPPEAIEDAQAWRLASLAGEILAEVGVDTARTSAGGEELCQRVRCRLVALIEGEKLPVRDRAAAGDVLAAIGDPRFRACAEWCLPADEMLGFVEIPAGPFLMGSDWSRDSRAAYDELPQHQVELPAFWMARFLVTVGQFRSFVQATGAKLEDEDGLRKPATHPMTIVSLDEAVAYCAWLDQVLRSWPRLPGKLKDALARGKVTLPSEAEWEKAARGTDGRIYPWGDEWNPERANVGETGLMSTSAVGCFLSGKSPFGCDDMSGNVWQRTRSLGQKYPYPAEAKARAKREAPGGSELRVMRGASFVNYQRDARSACRYEDRPGARDYNLGFRVVVSPSFSDP
jgi:formylglycine-generating enzyme required for sulfatase activity